MGQISQDVFVSSPECDSDSCPDCEISFSVATGDSLKAHGHIIKHQNSYRRPSGHSSSIMHFRQVCLCANKKQKTQRHFKRFVRDQPTKRTRRLCSSNSRPLFLTWCSEKGPELF